MTQTVLPVPINPSGTDGVDLALFLDNFQAALLSGLSGSARPPELTTGGNWVDDSTANILIFNLYDGTIDIEIFRVDNGVLKFSSFEVDEINFDSSLISKIENVADELQFTDSSGTFKLNDLTIKYTGQVIYSPLDQTQINSLYGSNKFLLCNGQSCAGSQYELITGNSNVPDLEGYFLRGSSIDSSVDQSGPRPALDVQEDTLQGHTHTWTAFDVVSVGNNSQPTHSGTSDPRTIGTAGYQGIASDGTHGTARVSSETRPKNVAMNIYIGIN